MGGFLTLQDFYKQESTSAFLKVFAMKGQFLLLLLFVCFISNPSWTFTSMKVLPGTAHHVNLTAFRLLYTLLSEVRPLIPDLAVAAMANCYIFVCLLLINVFIFNWRIIALQWSVCFCHRPAQVSHNCTIFSPSWAFLSPTPSHSSRSSESARLGCLCYIAGSH